MLFFERHNKSLLLLLTLVGAAFIIIAQGLQSPFSGVSLLSKFDNSISVEEKITLVERFNSEDIKEFKKSVAKIEKRLIPVLEKDIERIKKKLPHASGEKEQELRSELKNAYKDKQLYKEAVIGYKQLITWYEEWAEGIITEDYSNVLISSDESSIFFVESEEEE